MLISVRLSYLYTLIILTLLVESLSAKEDFRTFTNADGAVIRVKILKADPEHVWIERDDGTKFQVPLERLSVDDRQQVVEWRRREGALPPDALRFTASRFHDGPQRTSYEAVRLERSDGRLSWDHRGIQHVSRTVGYQVILENRLSDSLDGLRAEYRIYTKRSASELIMAAEGKSDLGNIQGWKKAEFKTTAVETLRTNNRYTSEASRNRSTELAGVWVRVFQGELPVATFSLPASLVEDVEPKD